MEILVALSVGAILMALAIPFYIGYMDKARTIRAIAEIKLIAQQIEVYTEENNDIPPDSLAQGNVGDVRDPWGNEYRYFNIRTAKGKGQMRKNRFMVPINSDFDLYSAGKDGETRAPLTAIHSRDDIIRADDGLYIGLVSRY